MPPILIAALLLALSAAAAPAAATHAGATGEARSTHSHPGGVHAHSDSAEVAPGRPAAGWSTDAALRTGMGRIRRSVEALEHYRRGHMAPEQALEIVASIETEVAGIVANCKLDPAADAALHAIIAKLLRGAGALKANPARFAAIDPMREALADYGRTFDDPGFRVQVR